MSSITEKIKIEKYTNALREIKGYTLSYYEEQANSSTKFGARFKDHCEAIESAIRDITGDVKFGHDEEYTSICWFVLGAVSWIHPINSFEIEQSEKTKFYTKIDQIIKDKEIDSNTLTLIKGIADNSRTDLSKCPIQGISTKKFYGKLLGSYFHVAYKLHLNEIVFSDNFRTNNLCEIFIKKDEGVSRDLKIQWLKTIFIDQIMFNRDDKTVEIYLQLPPKWNENKENENLKNEILIHLINQDIMESLEVVKDIFIQSSDKEKGEAVKNSHFNNMFVAVNFHEKKMEEHNGRFKLGNEKVDKHYFKQILFNAALLIYPNATKLINISIENIKRIASSDIEPNNNYDSKERSLKEFQNFLNELILSRPCHAGLIIIKDIIDIQIKKFATNTSSTKQIMQRVKDKIEYFEQIRTDTFDKLVQNALPLFLDGGNILLYGNSDTISKVLNKISSVNDLKERINIFISECRNKTQYNYNNSFLYCDAIEYAKKIEEIGFKNIFIVSEAVLGNLLARKGLISKVCFGANGIDLTSGDCAHTVGHLMISQLANINYIPVYVFADTAKFYYLKDWNLDGKRVNNWLAGKSVVDKEFEKKVGSNIVHREIDVQRYNLREDRVPSKLITYYVTDEGFIPSKQINDFLERRKEDIKMIIGS